MPRRDALVSCQLNKNIFIIAKKARCLRRVRNFLVPNLSCLRAIKKSTKHSGVTSLVLIWKKRSNLFNNHFNPAQFKKMLKNRLVDV
jgi:hypothetical protein